MRSYYDFFAGGGMVRAGLGVGWACLFANDIDPKKVAAYSQNWGASTVRLEDVAALTTADLPGTPDLAWASFPCQDLSLAGNGAGLRGKRSSTFWPFWRLMEALANENRAPTVIALENVCGALTSHGGKDFATLSAAIIGGGYRFGALVIDAVHFLPQSRPRLFVIAVKENHAIPESLISIEPDGKWHTGALGQAYRRLSEREQKSWIWWRLALPPKRKTDLSDLIEEQPKGVKWHTATETLKLLGMMSPLNVAKVASAKRAGRRAVGTIYKRTRLNENGGKIQRAEIRFDNIAGCLRTPVGGSSRQTILLVEGNQVQSRLLSAREAARLMGLPEDYTLPENYNESYHLAGDGVVVPAIRHIAESILEPILAAPKAI